jgi:hypothetical protein
MQHQNETTVLYTYTDEIGNVISKYQMYADDILNIASMSLAEFSRR